MGYRAQLGDYAGKGSDVIVFGGCAPDKRERGEWCVADERVGDAGHDSAVPAQSSRSVSLLTGHHSRWPELGPTFVTATGARSIDETHAAVARHLVDLLERGIADELAATLGVIERLHTEGDAYVQELATIGYLEDLQAVAARSLTVEPDDFVPLLGPESRRWWRGLNAFWSGEAPPPVRQTE
jgi:hypothetical protein